MHTLLWAGAALAALELSCGFALAQTYVRPYVRSDGTYVQPHFRSSPNGSTLDNWSTKGNTNPYTGKSGTVDPFKPKSNSLFR